MQMQVSCRVPERSDENQAGIARVTSNLSLADCADPFGIFTQELELFDIRVDNASAVVGKTKGVCKVS